MIEIKNMELTVKIGYNQIIELIHQLPKRDVEKLVKSLQKEVLADPSTKKIQDIILEAPTWSKSEVLDFKAARNSINKSRIA